MNKIAVIGKGTAGSLAYNHFGYYTDYEIDVYFDSSKKEQSVGEGTTIAVPRTLHYTTGFEFHNLDLIDGNYKNAIKYINWVENDFHHTFEAPAMSMHFNAVKLQEYLESKNLNRVNFIDTNISNLQDLDADFVIDCSGTPQNFDEYEYAEYIPVNAALVKQCHWEYPKFDTTHCIASEWGWIFVIPLKNRVSFGYLYNDKITDVKIVREQLNEVIDNYKYTPKDKELTLNFNNYYRKNNFYKNKAYNGNASFFLEPMEATSLTTVDNINRKIFDLINQPETVYDANNWYSRTFKELQDIIVMHYLGATKYDNEFWTYAKQLAEECLSDTSKTSRVYKEVLRNINNKKFDLNIDYGVWRMHSFNQNINNMKLLNKLKKLADV